MSAMTEVPKFGTKVRRKRDGQSYMVGSVYGADIQLHPVWDGRTHKKKMRLFLEQYELAN